MSFSEVVRAQYLNMCKNVCQSNADCYSSCAQNANQVVHDTTDRLKYLPFIAGAFGVGITIDGLREIGHSFSNCEREASIVPGCLKVLVGGTLIALGTLSIIGSSEKPGA